MDEEALRTRLARVDAMACLALGRTKGLEYGLRFLIATHPDRAELERSWQQLIALAAETHLDTPEALPDAAMYRAGIQQALAVMSQQFGVQREDPQEPQD